MIETNFPLDSAGAISAIYIGERLEAIPIPTPPTTLHIINHSIVSTKPVPTAARVKKIEATIIKGFLPYLSDRLPEIITPSKHPKMALPITHPCIEGELVILKKTS
ncbi:hypothetical protein D3C84_1052280 [compost metagenome]